MNPCVKDDPTFVEKYTTLHKWYQDYMRTLRTLAVDHEFLCSTHRSEPTPSIRVVVDSFDVIRYCFPFNTGISSIRKALAPEEEEYRADVFRRHAARSCIFHGLPSMKAILVLPPHYAEVTHFFEAIGSKIQRAEVEAELADLILPTLEPFEKRLGELANSTSIGAPPLLPDAESQLLSMMEEISVGFDEIALAAMGVYSDGLRMLENLLRIPRVAGIDSEQAIERFFGPLDEELDKALTGQSSTYAHKKGVQDWYERFRCIRPSFSAFLNMNDARAVESVIQANQSAEFRSANTFFLFVSGTSAMPDAIVAGADAAMIQYPHGGQTSIFRSLDHFFSYLLLCEDLPQPVVGETRGPGGREIHCRNLDRIRDRIEGLQTFEETLRLVDRQFERCGINVEDRNSQPVECLEDCALRDQAFRRQVGDALDELSRSVERSRDASILQKRHPILQPYMQAAESNLSEKGIHARIGRLLVQFKQGASWSDILEKYIGEIRQLFSADSGDLFADLSPFSRDIPQYFVDTFFEFPFRIRFASPRLREKARQLSALARSGQANLTQEKIQRATREFRLAATHPESRAELDLVRALLLFSFEDWRKTIDITARYTSDNAAGASEFVLLEARSHAELYLREKNNISHLQQARDVLLRHSAPDALDPRMKRTYAVVMSLQLLFHPNEGDSPQQADVEQVFESALRTAETMQGQEGRDHLVAGIRNSWAYLLSHLDRQACDRGLQLMDQMPISDRGEWYATWLHTEGCLHLAVATHAQAEGDAQGATEHLGHAISLLLQAHEGAASNWLRGLIQGDLARAQLRVQEDTADPEE